MRFERLPWKGAIWSLVLVAALLGYIFTIDKEQFAMRDVQVKMVVAIVFYVIAMVLVFRNYLLIRGVVVGDKQLTVERVWLDDLQMPYAGLEVSHRAKARGGVEGLMIEQRGKDEPYFLSLQGFPDPDALLTALEKKVPVNRDGAGRL